MHCIPRGPGGEKWAERLDDKLKGGKLVPLHAGSFIGGVEERWWGSFCLKTRTMKMGETVSGQEISTRVQRIPGQDPFHRWAIRGAGWLLPTGLKSNQPWLTGVENKCLCCQFSPQDTHRHGDDSQRGKSSLCVRAWPLGQGAWQKIQLASRECNF